MEHSSDSVQTDQYLTFTLDNETYAIEIFKVREVIHYINITHVPRMPRFLSGIINLRGNVVSVIDLRQILEMEPIEKTVDTCIIFAEVTFGDEGILLGMLADSVQEVIEVDTSQIGPPPRMGTMLDTEFIKGVGKRGDNFFIILNIDKVLGGAELSVVRKVNAGGGQRSEAAVHGKAELALPAASSA
ncbi:MAG: purine-binding chemotaxis protein CheW [Alphaproteobacteria bacterium]|nr:purine-binding chemotaxis protein CheW [Alphaproteobacteria bacterium]